MIDSRELAELEGEVDRFERRFLDFVERYGVATLHRLPFLVEWC